MEKKTRYVHQSLDENSIRLLQITAVEGEVWGSLHHFLLNDAPPYEAISYCWGTSALTQHINLGAAGHNITPNVHAALRCVHATLRPRWLWIDAICISQSSPEEKAQQVALMWRVFSMAQRIIVWLGAEAGNSDQAMDAIPFLCRIPDSLGVKDEETFDEIPQWRLDAVNCPRPGERIWSHFFQIFSRGWFRRLWVVQEAILGRDIVVICGLKTVQWQQLIQIITLMRSTRIMKHVRASWDSTSKPAFADIMRDLGVLKMVDLMRTRKLRFPYELTIVHSSLFDLVMDKETFEPVDRVYSLLGILDDNFRRKIVVDYSLECRENYWKVYAAFVKVLLLAPGGLSIWQRLSERERLPCLPSWCPNLNGSEVSHKYLSFGGVRGTEPIQEPSVSEHETRFYALTVRGLCFDRLLAVVPLHQQANATTSERIAAILQQEQNIRQTLSQFPSWSIWDEPHRVVLWRTLVGNSVFKLDSQSADIGLASFIGPFEETMALFKTSLHDSNSVFSTKEFAQLYMQSMAHQGRGKIFFVTEKGHIGIGPLGSRAGDMICVIPGFNMQMIMRFARQDAAENLWQFIGPASMQSLSERHISDESNVKDRQATFVVV